MPNTDPIMPSPAPLLAVTGLEVHLGARRDRLRAIADVSFTVARGETLCIVGESGSGKTLTALALMSLLPPRIAVTGGAIEFNGRDLLTLDAASRARLYGDEIAMIFQDPMSSLNPVLTIGRQIDESLRRHQPALARAARTGRAEQALGMAGIVDAAGCMKKYPHELSGGMCQRVLIAIALVNHPQLIIADEPTTALDVTVQAQVMKSMRAACRQTGAALLLITHDLSLVARYADRVAVMYAGRIVEQGKVQAVFGAPRHPYTRALLASIPSLDTPVDRALEAIAGEPPDFARLPSGCAFRPRCTLCRQRAICADRVPPPLADPADTYHLSACHFADELIMAAPAGRTALCR
ncbi:ABC transporter ATP-binding protein [Sodalis sp. RH21]|uniref:ABC transporter ATP-binding protein n=1 Tax=unclassified Sodalis (in: enterobacteria) TaxID=2636512 RepID=UPI0039B5FC8B